MAEDIAVEDQIRIKEGASVTLHPCKAEDLKVGDVVLADVRGKRFTLTVLHLIMDVSEAGFLIGNNLGRIDGCVAPASVYGKVVDVQE